MSDFDFDPVVQLNPQASSNVNAENPQTHSINGGTKRDSEGQPRSSLRQTSRVWGHFTRRTINGEIKAVCNHCGKGFAGQQSSGTLHLLNHIDRCPKRIQELAPAPASSPSQASKVYKKKDDETSTISAFDSTAFDKVLARQKIVRMINHLLSGTSHLLNHIDRCPKRIQESAPAPASSPSQASKIYKKKDDETSTISAFDSTAFDKALARKKIARMINHLLSGTSHLLNHIDRCPKRIQESAPAPASSPSQASKIYKKKDDETSTISAFDSTAFDKALARKKIARMINHLLSGTSHLLNHIDRCPKRIQESAPAPASSPSQASKIYKKKDDETSTISAFDSTAFDKELARQKIARMIIMHELPLRFVEYEGFRDLMSFVQPLLGKICRNTVKREVFKLFEFEKAKTMALLEDITSKVSITMDMWTSSNQKKGYMVVRAHFIDNSWTLRNQILRFIYVPSPHTVEALSNELAKCLLDWNVDRRLSTITIDICSTNDVMILLLLAKFPPDSFLLNGKLLHVRCYAHILNLIVKDGLDTIGDGIEKVRNIVNYWTSSPKSIELFEDTANRQLKLNCSKSLVLDCKTRWNSTYLMLEVALIYKDVFTRLKHRDNQYKHLPTEVEWELARVVCEHLKPFYTMTEMFSGTKYPIANLFFPIICEIRLSSNAWLNSSCDMIKKYGENSSSVVMGMWDVQKFNAFKNQYIHKRVKSKLDTYLEEEDKTTPDFDILMWWKVNRSRYLIFSEITRDLLDVPVSIVASESAFSAGGRCLSPHRNRLHPSIVEALMCTHNWIWTQLKGEIPKDKVMNGEEINREMIDNDDEEETQPCSE
ncbi:BED-type domain-containing protein [Citrus sinensis]|nr:BED-type domain-containing protein [Citrus sinensis]